MAPGHFVLGARPDVIRECNGSFDLTIKTNNPGGDGVRYTTGMSMAAPPPLLERLLYYVSTLMKNTALLLWMMTIQMAVVVRATNRGDVGRGSTRALV